MCVCVCVRSRECPSADIICYIRPRDTYVLVVVVAVADVVSHGISVLGFVAVSPLSTAGR